MFRRLFEQYLRELNRGVMREVERRLVPVEHAMDWWLGDLFARPLPSDWREQWNALLARLEYEHRVRFDPTSTEQTADWLENWAKRCGLLPKGGEKFQPNPVPKAARQLSSDDQANPNLLGDLASVRNIPPTAPDGEAAAARTSDQFFDEKLAVAQGCLDEIKRILESLGGKLDTAKVEEPIEVESEADAVEGLIWECNDALEAARAAWLRDNLSGDANTRLLEMATPATFGLPMFTDEAQAERARRQGIQISERLGRRDVILGRVELGMKVIEGAGTVAGILLGGGMILNAAKKGGKWAIVKTIAIGAASAAAEQGAEAGLRAAGIGESTIRGVRLAATVVSFILLRRRIQVANLETTKNANAISPDVHQAILSDVAQPKTGLVPTVPDVLGKWGEIRLKNLFGGRGFKPRRALKTTLGNRFVDWMVDGVAHEAKAGLNVKLTSRIREQALKDAELFRTARAMS